MVVEVLQGNIIHNHYVTVTFCGHGAADGQEEPRNSKDAVAETFLAHWMI